MNWDWDKLQEKRQKQPGPTAPKKEDRDRHEPPRQGGGGGGGGHGPNLGQMGDAFKKMRQSRFPVIKISLALVALLWLASGVFIIQPSEVGVVLRFGENVRLAGPGPNYHLPYPIETVFRQNTQQIYKLEIGYTNSGRGRQSKALEAPMLTSDENIIYVHFDVFYRVEDAEKFLFNTDMQMLMEHSSAELLSFTVKSAAESAMREIIGSSTIDEAMYTEKAKIMVDCRARLQTILNRYSTGVLVTNLQLMDVLPPPDVAQAFTDLINAREDQARFKTEAEAYTNRVVPEARGFAAETINRAKSYEVSVRHKADGESARFLKLLAEYNKAQDITKKRMYLETMQEVFSSPGMEKVLLGSDVGGKVLPYLPLDRLSGGGSK